MQLDGKAQLYLGWHESHLRPIPGTALISILSRYLHLANEHLLKRVAGRRDLFLFAVSQ
jgi:hypothetical protein